LRGICRSTEQLVRLSGCPLDASEKCDGTDPCQCWKNIAKIDMIREVPISLFSGSPFADYLCVMIDIGPIRDRREESQRPADLFNRIAGHGLSLLGHSPEAGAADRGVARAVAGRNTAGHG
jgi:hypothetical protein